MSHHPLLNELVLKKVYRYLKGTDKYVFKSLAEYRLVCKIWDREIAKLIRPHVRICLTRLIQPVPFGFGWTGENDDEDNNGSGCRVPPFINISVPGTCTILRDSRIAEWFEVNGLNVMDIEFKSSLTCYHQTHFVESLLRWLCPNLESLTLRGVECVESLLHNSHFLDSSDLMCDNLKEVVLSVEDKQTSDTAVSSISNGRNWKGKNEWGNWAPCEKKKTIKQSKERDLGDGGLLGKSMKSVAVEKLGIMKWAKVENIAMERFQSGMWSESLKHLEFRNDTHCWNALDPSCWSTLNLGHFPITSLEINGRVYENLGWLGELLKMLANTLESFKIGELIEARKELEFEFPVMPKLKTFENRSAILCQVYNPWYIVRNAKNLERFVLFDDSSEYCGWQKRRAVDKLFWVRRATEQEHSLKEMRIGVPIFEAHIPKLVLFPVLVKVEFVVNVVDFANLVNVLSGMEKLRYVKFSIDNRNPKQCDFYYLGHVKKLKDLKYLELVCIAKTQPCGINLEAITFQEGFGAMEKLKFLKLTNLGIFMKERPQIETSLKHIPFVQFYKCKLINTIDSLNCDYRGKPLQTFDYFNFKKYNK